MEDPLLDPKEPTEQGRDLDPSEKIIAKTEKEVVSETVKNSGTLDAKVAAAGQAVSSANDGEQKKILKEAVDQASPEARKALRQMLLPGQKAIDRIWQTNGRGSLRFCPLCFYSCAYWGCLHDTDQGHAQILLTVFTTVAGILAGFISGKAVGTALISSTECGWQLNKEH
jgi:hypothetical protein